MNSPAPEEVFYTAEFIDGPLEGEVDSRVLVQGAHQSRISMISLVDGIETVFWYDEVDERDVQGRIHVRYRFDATESDPYVPEDQPELNR